jgi:hypothetical protein
MWAARSIRFMMPRKIFEVTSRTSSADGTVEFAAARTP